MLLTCFYMAATIIQARRLSSLKARLYAILKENKSLSSVVFNTRFSGYQNGDCNGHDQDKNSMTSSLCLNKGIARLGELLWYEENMKLCTIYPQQQVDVSEWLAYPFGNTLFPLQTKNCCQILNKPELKMHILVEIDQGYLERPAWDKISLKLEDHGLIIAWTINKNMNVILETDIERTISFITILMQGQHYTNNGLLLLRIQSILVSGEPCTRDNERYTLTLNKCISNRINRLSGIIPELEQQLQYKPVIETAQLYDIKDQPQNKDLNIEAPTDSAKMIKDVAANIMKLNVKFPECEPVSNIVSSEKEPTITNEGETADNSTKADLSMERKDDISVLDINSKIYTQNINEVPHNKKLQIPSMCSDDFKGSKYNFKPPNVAIYAESPDAVNNIQTVLRKVLDRNRYIIYALSKEQAGSNAWIKEFSLVVVYGHVDSEIIAQLKEYIVEGGRLLVLCSDMLHILLPIFKIAEVRENELVHFSYGKWERVRLMHDIFCYQASPVRTFSQDHEDTSRVTTYASITECSYLEVKNRKGKVYKLDVEILGAEETWHNPSILLATLASKGSKVIFSQIHLELDPMEYEHEEDKFKVLKENDAARLEIISDLLSRHLQMEITDNMEEATPSYTPAYFLCHPDERVSTLQTFLAYSKKLEEDNKTQNPKLKIQCIPAGHSQIPASATFLPILTDACPTTFDSERFFSLLTATEYGSTLIYADVLTSTMDVIERFQGWAGLTVVTLEQTKGRGRSCNAWLSPYNCVAFSVQVHIDYESYMAERLSLLQHIAAVALVSAVRSREGYENIDLRVKWPNDIYVGKHVKIGGVMVTARTEMSTRGQYMCSIGAGINLNNDKPTTCINHVIREYNNLHGTDLKCLNYEEYLAHVLIALDELIYKVQYGPKEDFCKLYYRYWLHSDSNVDIINSNGEFEKVEILGIDTYGYLLVKGKQNKEFSVQPDGNSFDLLKGLIAPK